MKRVKLTHGSARVEDDCSPETIKALDELSKAAYNHDFKKPKCPYCGKTEPCEGQPPEGCFLDNDSKPIL